jgi:hypothetical protein
MAVYYPTVQKKQIQIQVSNYPAKENPFGAFFNRPITMISVTAEAA